MVLTGGRICFLLLVLWVINLPIGNFGGFGPILSAEVAVFLVINSVVFSFFLVLTVNPSWLHENLQIGTYEAWKKIVNFFILTKVMQQSVNLLENLLLSKAEDITVCFASKLRPDSTFPAQMIFVVVVFAMELIETAYISVMPIPWFTTMFYCIFQLMAQSMRIRSCFGAPSKKYFSQDPANNDSLYIKQLLHVAVISVSIMSMITANIISRSMKETDRNILISQEAVQRKQSLVQVMCSDVTVSLQNVIEVVSVLKRDMKDGVESDGGSDSTADKDADIAKCMSTMLKSIDYESVLINELLLLARIEEGRFSYHCINELALKNLIDELVQLEFGEVNRAYVGRLRIEVRKSRFCAASLPQSCALLLYSASL